MRFHRNVKADERIVSAKLAIRTLLALEGQLYPQHLRELLSICLWKLTEAEGRSKHKTRYQSAAALTAPSRELRHDHVLERKKLIEKLLEDPAHADQIADLAVGCTVTRTEHDELTRLSRDNPALEGWDRYRAAGIEVIDTLTGAPRGAA